MGMNFAAALRANTNDEREALIEEQIYDHPDEFDIDDGMMTHGGFPDDEEITDIEHDDIDAESITARVTVEFDESVASSCKDYNHTHKKAAHFTLTIQRSDGHYNIECADWDETMDGDDDPDDYYSPDDYR
jgi:hypothetical protein